MAQILDTYNLLHAARAQAGAFADLNVRRLCQWITQSPRRQKTTLVLDGRPKPDEPSENEFPELTFVYSGAGIPADKIIAQIVERSKNRRNLTIVTNDRAVATHARLHFAGAISCETFLASLLSDTQNASSVTRSRSSQKPTPSQSPGEIDLWLKEFNIEAPLTPPKPKSDPDSLDDLDMNQLMGGPPD